MTPYQVRAQIEDLIGRLIMSGLSVKQFNPSERAEGAERVIGRTQSSAMALKNIDYADIYEELERTESYDAKLVDGGLILLQYRFDRQNALLQHRLAYFPCPVLPSIDDVPELYEADQLYGDIIERRLVRFPIRFDFAPEQKIDVVHPISHLTLGQYENCRIPVSGPVGPHVFGNFIVRNFYCRAYTRNKNHFERKPPVLTSMRTITAAEQKVCHFVHAG
ncbi:MAG: DUF2290 domain-containing protein [Pseudorhodoferax sp.]